MTETGPKMKLTAVAKSVMSKRYLKKAADGTILETPEDMLSRVAATVAAAGSSWLSTSDVDKLRQDFFDIMVNQLFLPNSPTLMNAGRELGQLSACFVLPVGDSMEEIFDAIKNTALIHKSGGGTGFSFSRLRPANDTVNSTMGVSSGPISFMEIFDSATEKIKQGGTRRGANMGILRVDHPDILDFITCKDDQKKLNNFNISVAATEEFMEAVDKDAEYAIRNPRTKEVVKYLRARDVFDKIVSQAWKNGEPGIIFIDRINALNTTPAAGEIESTNPCGEQPLPPNGSCVLGSINLSKLTVNSDDYFNWEELRRVVKLAVLFLDGVLTVNKYPLPQIEEASKKTRNIGIGVMGWADALYQLGIRYGSEESIQLAKKVMSFITEEARSASEELAGFTESFPEFEKSVWPSRGRKKMRNAALTTIAPTGTLSIFAGCSSGVEPAFGISFIREIMDKDIFIEVNPVFEALAKRRGFYSESLMKTIAETGSIQHLTDVPEDVKRVFVTTTDISPEEHVKMQAAFQEFTDNAVSKTINLPATATKDDVASAYRLAYALGCKGVTIYRDKSRDLQVLSTAGPAVTETPATIELKKDLTPTRERPKALSGLTYQVDTGCGPLYITINEDDHGTFELFTTMGKAGGCAAAQCETIGRLISLAWRSGVQANRVLKQLVGINCSRPHGFGENRVTSCADAVAKAIQLHLESKGECLPTTLSKLEPRGACPECGGQVEHEGGCCVCRSCGYSECA